MQKTYIPTMAETASEMPATKSFTHELAFEQLIRMQASMAVAQQVRDRFWLTLTSLGLGALVVVETVNIVIGAGLITFPLSANANATGLYQSAILAILIAMTMVFLYGRMRLIRAEMDLFRLKLEIISEGNDIGEPEGAADSPALALLRGMTSERKRALDLGSDT